MDPEHPHPAAAAPHHDPLQHTAHVAHNGHAAVDAVGGVVHDVSHAADHAHHLAHPAPVTIPSQATGGMRAGPAIEVPGVPTGPNGALSRSAGALRGLQRGLSIGGGVAGLVTTPLAAREALLGNREGNTDRTVNGLTGVVGGVASVIEGGATVAGLMGVGGAGTVAAAAAPVAVAAAGFTGGYGLGRHLDNSIGDLRGELGATREVTNRDGSTSQVRDNRSPSAMLGDGLASNRTASNAALSIAPYLPRFLGGDWAW